MGVIIRYFDDVVSEEQLSAKWKLLLLLDKLPSIFIAYKWFVSGNHTLIKSFYMASLIR